ncbi:MAG: pilus assembly protein [Asticcacaulis sp.]
MISLIVLSRALRLKSFSGEARGATAVEFALIAPILILLYLGLAELTMGMMVSRRVSHLTAAIGDLAAQSGELTEANITDLFDIGDTIMQPFSTGDQLDVRLTSVQRDNSDRAVVLWSRGQDQYTKGQILNDVDISDVSTGQGLIITDVNYRYTSVIGNLMPGVTNFTKRYRHFPRDGNVVTGP